MFRLTIQLRHYAKNAKINVKSEQSEKQIKRVPIFHLNERDVQHTTRKSTKQSKSTSKSQAKTNRIPLISCARPEFNLYKNKFVPSEGKYESIPLASGGWQHYKSKNDCFTIHATEVNFNTSSEVATDTEWFNQFNLDSTLVENLASQLNVRQATSIQTKAIPAIESGAHTLIAAETGCGKTIAFLTPIIMSVLKQKQAERNTGVGPLNSPRAIILSPSRELALQIGEVAKKLSRNLDLQIDVLIGGSTKKKVSTPDYSPTDILIGSIGATSKLITTAVYRLDRVKQVVLDEADTMLDESFSGILEHLMRRFGFSENAAENKRGVQLIMAGATLPENTYELLKLFIDPETVREVVSPNLHKLLPQIQQKFIRMRKSQRPLELLSIVKSEVEKNRPVIVFANKSATADYVSIFLNENGVDTVSLNGDALAKIRIGQFAKFQSGEVNVLATTDVSSRGLDTTRACHVINFDFPYHMTDYLHRIGRIGRMGSDRNGNVTNFISNLREVELTRKIEHIARTRGIFSNVNNNFTRKIKKPISKSADSQPPDSQPPVSQPPDFLF